MVNERLDSCLGNVEFQDMMEEYGEFGKDLTKRTHQVLIEEREMRGYIRFGCSRPNINPCSLVFMKNMYDDWPQHLGTGEGIGGLSYRNTWLECDCPQCTGPCWAIKSEYYD